MGMFDDLIPDETGSGDEPQGGVATAPSRSGLFDDLVPAEPERTWKRVSAPKSSKPLAPITGPDETAATLDRIRSRMAARPMTVRAAPGSLPVVPEMAPRDVTATPADATVPGLRQRLRNQQWSTLPERVPAYAGQLAKALTVDQVLHPVETAKALVTMPITDPARVGAYVGNLAGRAGAFGQGWEGGTPLEVGPDGHPIEAPTENIIGTPANPTGGEAAMSLLNTAMMGHAGSRIGAVADREAATFASALDRAQAKVDPYAAAKAENAAGRPGRSHYLPPGQYDMPSVPEPITDPARLLAERSQPIPVTEGARQGPGIAQPSVPLTDAELFPADVVPPSRRLNRGPLLTPPPAPPVRPFEQALQYAADQRAGRTPESFDVDAFVARGRGELTDSELERQSMQAVDHPVGAAGPDAGSEAVPTARRGVRTPSSRLSANLSNDFGPDPEGGGYPRSGAARLPIATTLGGGAAGGVAGSFVGDTPEERQRNAALGFMGGAVVGAWGGSTLSRALDDAAATTARARRPLAEIMKEGRDAARAAGAQPDQIEDIFAGRAPAAPPRRLALRNRTGAIGEQPEGGAKAPWLKAPVETERAPREPYAVAEAGETGFPAAVAGGQRLGFAQPGVVTTLGSSAAGGVAGSFVGDTPEERQRNAALGAIGGFAAGATAARLFSGTSAALVPKPGTIRDALQVIGAPATRGSEAESAANILRAHTGNQRRTYEQAVDALDSFRTAADKMPEPDRLDFIHRLETGQAQATPELTRASAQIRHTLDSTRDEIRNLGTGALDHFIQDYFPHIWADPAEAQTVIGSILGKRPLAGSKAFLKARTIPTTADGIAAGLVPVTTNPVDLTLLKLREMQRYLMAQRALTDMKGEGLLQLVAPEMEGPAGYVKIDSRTAQIPGDRTPEGVRTITGSYWAPEPVARIVNNFLSPGLRGNPLYDIVRSGGNMMNQAQLGLSAFHLGFTSMDAAVSRTALGIEEVFGGEPIKGLASMASTPVAPITNILKGRKVRAEYLKPGSIGGSYAELAQAVADAGGSVRMDGFYKGDAPRAFLEAIRQGTYGTATAKSIPALLQTTMAPIMEHIVPMQKLGVFADLAERAVAQLPEGASVAERRMALAKAWDSVDNRLGQLVYDNLFWDKTFKDLAMVGVRSVGWNLGTWRELGGGVADAARGKLTHRSAYLAALPMTVGAAGAITNYLYTGEAPKSLEDYFFPRTGTFDADGNPNRVQLPSYMKDVVAYGRHPWQTVKAKVNPIVGTVVDMLNNSDFYGDKIRNEDAPGMTQIKQSAQYIGKQFLPFAVRNMMEAKKREDRGGTADLSFVGITPASRELIRSPAQNMLMRMSPRGGARTPEDVDASNQRRDVLEAMRSGKDVTSDAVAEALSSGNLTTPQMNRLLRRAQTLPIIERFKALPLDKALQVYNAGDAREKSLWFDVLQAKLAKVAP